MIASRRDGAYVRQLQALFNLGTIRDLTDGQLLERFATEAGEVAELAFSALVERHEAMVWRVCLAIVRNEHDAEEAFQATFLVLLRKARSLWVQQSLGPWLHQVAYRTASCLRRTVIRRRKYEQRCAARDASGSIEIGASRDLDRDAAIHEEVNRLPEKYRAPIVLCDLEGRTHQEAARFIGWPIGTVKSRQLQGRQLLRDRLVRRGLGPAVAAAVVESLRQTKVAAMSLELSRTTVNAALQPSVRLLSEFGVSARVFELTQEVLRAMFWIRLRYVATVTLALGIASGGASVYVSGSQELAPKDGQPASDRATTTTAHSRQPEISKDATGQPATAESRARLRAQQLATRKAKALYEIARQTRELAAIAVEEYEEVKYPQDLATVGADLNRAKSDLTRSQDRLEWAKRMFEKGYISEATKVSEVLNHKKAAFGLEQVQSRRTVLVDYTKSKTINELRGAVDIAGVEALEKKALWDSEKSKEIELERQLGQGTN